MLAVSLESVSDEAQHLFSLAGAGERKSEESQIGTYIYIYICTYVFLYDYIYI